MGFLDTIFGGLGSAVAGVASGGVLSLLGVVVKGVSAFVSHKQDMEKRKLEWGREEKLELLRQQGKDQDTENELKITQSAGSWRGLAASYQTMIAPAHVHKWVNDVRSLFRPFLTVFLLVMTWFMFRDMLSVLRGNDAALSAAFTPEQAGETIRYIVYSTVFSACTAVTWWYGDRALSPPSGKNR